MASSSGTIADLIGYRPAQREAGPARHRGPRSMSAFGGEFRLIIYVNKVSYAEHIALVKGDPAAGGPVLVRMHALNVLDDVLPA
ncbi:MAG: hypothetical protein WDO24_00370 [Pseudomonadota bacterium]